MRNDDDIRRRRQCNETAAAAASDVRKYAVYSAVDLSCCATARLDASRKSEGMANVVLAHLAIKKWSDKTSKKQESRESSTERADETTTDSKERGNDKKTAYEVSTARAFCVTARERERETSSH